MKQNTWEKESNDLSLLDDRFLIAILEQKQRELYARIASLNNDEEPIEYIEGKISDGSINIDGDSSVRRTCNLTMIVSDVDISDVYWGIKTKFRLEIGVKNNLTDEQLIDVLSLNEEEFQASKSKNLQINPYPEIVWFPEGIYYITNFNTSITTKGYNISLSGKDKMVMLTGELGGQIFASTDFGKKSVSEIAFIPIAEGAASAETLMSKVLYQKTDIKLQRPYILSNDTDFKFVPSSTGNWVRFENRYYKLSELFPDSPENGPFIKNIEVPLPGLTFTPVNGITYFYEPFETNPVSNKEPSSNDFPAQTNADHSGIIIYDTVGNELKKLEFKVFQQLVFSNKRYESYAKIINPNDMYESVEGKSFIYEPNKYYFKKNIDSSHLDDDTGYYVLDTSKSQTFGRSYYELKTLYTLDTSVTITKMPLEEIIREMIHAYALEPYQNIIINNLEEFGLEQLTYKGDEPLYALRDLDTGEFSQLAFASQNQWLKNIVNNPNFLFDKLVDFADAEGDAVTMPPIYYQNQEISSGKQYSIAKILNGMDIGYRITDLVYTGDLISAIGDSLTSILDKIKDMLGNFEYFYDLDGHFVFQKKPTYVDTSWSVLTNNKDEQYTSYLNEDYKKFAFNFEGNRLITAFQNSPDLVNLKNDFSVWGKRTSITNEDTPIHARYAIDKKPKEYLAFNGILYYTKDALNDPSPEQAEELGKVSEFEIDIREYHHIYKIPNILRSQDGNNSDWWELRDWANYYHALTGVFPQQFLKDYGTEGFVGTLKFSESNEVILSGNGQLVIDFDTNTAIKNSQGEIIDYGPMTPLYRWQGHNAQGELVNGYWSPFQHRYNGCWHWYAQYLNYYNQYENMITYIYKPALPTEDIIAKDGGILKQHPDDKILVDWRELIYRMAIDYFAGQGCSEKEPIYNYKGEMVINNPDHFLSAVAERNPYYYGTGYTGYEQYYTDIQGFWRQLYNPDYYPTPIVDKGTFIVKNVRIDENSSFFSRQKVWVPGEDIGYKTEYYVGEDTWNGRIKTYYDNAKENINNLSKEKRSAFENFSQYYISKDHNVNISERLYWNINVFDHPEQLNFWLEFLDDQNELAEYSVPTVGDRSKVINEDKVGAIFYQEVPGFILVPNLKQDEQSGQWKTDISSLRKEIQTEGGYKFIFLPKGFDKYFDISYRKLSAKNKIDELLYQYAYCIENITLTALPVYHLQPNTRIYIRDDITRVNGEYIVKKITLPLKPGGTMNVSAIKAPERFY